MLKFSPIERVVVIMCAAIVMFTFVVVPILESMVRSETERLSELGDDGFILNPEYMYMSDCDKRYTFITDSRTLKTWVYINRESTGVDHPLLPTTDRPTDNPNCRNKMK